MWPQKTKNSHVGIILVYLTDWHKSEHPAKSDAVRFFHSHVIEHKKTPYVLKSKQIKILLLHPSCCLLPACCGVYNTDGTQHKQQQPVPEYSLLTLSRAVTQTNWFAIYS